MKTLKITPAVAKAIVRHAQNTPKHEVCGVLYGYANTITDHIAIENVASNAQHAFAMHPQALFNALKNIDGAKKTWLAIYHSHPTSDPIPSQTDIHESRTQYPNIAQIIISLSTTKPRIKAWRLQNNRVLELPLLLETQHIGNENEPLLVPSRLHIAIALAVTIIAALVLLLTSVALLPPPPILPTPIS